MGTETLEQFQLRHAASIAGVYERGNGLKWNLPPQVLAEAIYRSVRSSGIDGEQEIADYVARLHAEDFVLACACRIGIESAWEHFFLHYRPVLHGAARALERDETRAEELADSLYAELYGIRQREGRRRSLLEYFHGRSTLATWLRSVVAQRHVDIYRAERPMAPVEEIERTQRMTVADADPPDPDRTQYVEALGQALETALSQLNPRDRLRLSCYHVQELTLKEVGRLMGEHESSVSRRLDRTRHELRRRVERLLRRKNRMNDEQIRLCYDYALEQWPFDLSRAFSRRE